MASNIATYTLEVSTDQAKRSVQSLIDQFAKLGGVKVSPPNLDAGTRALKEQTKAVSGLQSAYRSFASFAASYVGFQAIQGQLEGVSDAIQKQQAALAKLRFANDGDTKKAADDFAFLKEQAQRLGQPLDELAQSYGGLAAATKGTVLQGEATKQVFLGVAEAATILKLSAEETEGSLLALTQMVSKGKVSAEEFRGQLGERLPIALEAGAKAMGVTREEFAKLLDAGKIDSASFLPKFAEELRKLAKDQLPAATQSFIASKNRLNNAILELRQNIGEGELGKAMQESIDKAAEALRSPAMQEGLQLVALGFAKAFEWSVKLFNMVSTGSKIVGSMGAMAASDFVAAFQNILPKMAVLFNRVAAAVKNAFAGVLESFAGGAEKVGANGLAASLFDTATSIRRGAAENVKAAAEARSKLKEIDAANEARKQAIRENLAKDLSAAANSGGKPGAKGLAITNLPTVKPSDGTEKGKKEADAAKKEAAALDALNKALTEYSEKQARALREQALAQLEADLDKRLISQQEYYQRKAAIERQALEEEEAAKNERIRQLQETIAGEKTAQDERLRAAAEIVKIRGELEDLNGRKAIIAIELDKNSEAVRRYLAELKQDLQANLLELQGDTSGAARSRLLAETERMLADARVKGDTEAQALIRQMAEAKGRIIDFEEAAQGLSRLSSELALTEQRIQRDLTKGAITEAEAQRQVREARLKTADAMLKQVEAAEELAALTGDPERILEAQRMRAAYEDLANTMDSLAVDINQTFFGSIKQGFQDLVSGAKSFGDVMRNIITSVLSKLAELALNRALTQLMGSMGGAGGGLGGMLAGLFSARATGGAVSADGAYIVGERGPEPFFPGQPGTVVPTARLQAALADMLGLKARRTPNAANSRSLASAMPTMGGSTSVSVAPKVVVAAGDFLSAIQGMPEAERWIVQVAAANGKRIQAGW